MIKVKIFAAQGYFDLENAINEWLEEEEKTDPNTKLVSIEYQDTHARCSALITYKKYEKTD